MGQSGRKLELFLETGSLYFNVTKALEADETFDIRTSTMVVGIRGTCGYVNVDDLFLIEGHTVVTDTEGNTVEVFAGQRLTRDRETGN